MANFKNVLKGRRESGQSLAKSLLTSSYDVAREKYDPINAMFKSGTFLNALFPKVSGFKASSVGKTPSISPTKLSMSGDSLSSDKLETIAEYSKISAKNSTVLPSLARDMFLVKENIVKLVKLQKGTPRTKAGDWFSRQEAREQALESKMFKSKLLSGNKKSDTNKKGSGLLGGLGSMFGGILGVGGAIIGGIGSLLGSVGGTIFKMVGLSLASLGPLGLILSGLLGFILYGAVKAFDFDKLKEDFSKVYNDATLGIKSFFNMDSEKSLFSGLIGGLDSAFGTNVFSEMTEYVKLTFELIKLDFQDFFTESTFIFESVLEEVKKLATSILVGLGISAGAGAALALRRARPLAAGAKAAGAAASSATASTVGKVVGKNALKIGGRVAAGAGLFAAGLATGPLGLLLSAYLVYDSYDTIKDMISLFTGVSDEDIKKLVEEGQLSEEEGDIIIKGRAAQARLQDLEKGSQSFQRQIEGAKGRPLVVENLERALADNEDRIVQTKLEINQMGELFRKSQGENISAKGPEIKRDLNLAKNQATREALMKQRSVVGQNVQRSFGQFGAQKPVTGGSPTATDSSSLSDTLADLIFQAEGTSHAKANEHGFKSGYDVPFGYGKYLMPPKPLSEMTIAEVKAFQKKQIEATKGKGIPGLRQNEGTSAVGIGQFMGFTIESLQKEMGFSDQEIFSPDLQNRMVHALLVRRGLNKLESRQISPEQFLNNLAKEWASIGTFGTGKSFFDGQPSNKDVTNKIYSKLRGAGSSGSSVIPAATPIASTFNYAKEEFLAHGDFSQALQAVMQPRIPAGAVTAATSNYNDTMREAVQGPPTTNNQITNIVQNAATQNQNLAPQQNVIDVECAKLLLGRAVGQ